MIIGNTVRQYGGGFYAGGFSAIIATGCTITSGHCFWGGAVFAAGDSTTTAIDCTMISNSAYWGGAVSAAADSTVAVTDCTMTANSAVHGGAVFVGDDGSRLPESVEEDEACPKEGGEIRAMLQTFTDAQHANRAKVSCP